MAIHNQRWLKRTVVLASVVLASLTSVVLTATPAHADEPRTTRISRAEIISRAQDWYDSAHTQFWAYEEANSAADMNHEVKSLSSYSSYTAYKYGDGDGQFDSYYESFDEIDGIESSTLTTSLDYCHVRAINVIRLTGYQDIAGDVYTCIRYEPSDDSIRGWMVFAWRPSSESDDSTTVAGRFDGFGLHPQLQVGDITHREAKCWIGYEINHAASGKDGCYVAISRGSYSGWSLDGWLNWDRNNDGLTWFGPSYQYGSPTI